MFNGVDADEIYDWVEEENERSYLFLEGPGNSKHNNFFLSESERKATYNFIIH
jgi:hypothetical protein